MLKEIALTQLAKSLQLFCKSCGKTEIIYFGLGSTLFGEQNAHVSPS